MRVKALGPFKSVNDFPHSDKLSVAGAIEGLQTHGETCTLWLSQVSINEVIIAMTWLEQNQDCMCCTQKFTKQPVFLVH